jgi:MoaA/NifB/PqqE/SkfB family radical SAM enzyme
VAVDIRDPAGRLPVDVRELLPGFLDGTLWAPDRSVPIHPESIRRFAKGLRQDLAACFVPEIPVASELGLPRYESLLYWLPGRVTALRRLWHRMHSRLATNGRNGAATIEMPADTIRVSDLTAAEAVHYFVEHLEKVCPKPLQVSVIVGNVCNLKCVMCPYHSAEIRPSHQTDFFKDRILMSWEMLDRLASECGEARIPVKIGNIEEPLLHPRIVEFVRACRTRGVPWIHITTNGLPLDEWVATELLDAGLSSLYVSIDASQVETYRRVRGADLATVESNLRRFLRLRREKGMSCNVMVSFVRNKGVSEDEIAAFRERWLKELDGVIFYNLAEYEAGNTRFTEINRVASDMMQRAGGRWPCLSPWQEIYVLPDGRIYYCCETVSKLAFENLQSMGSFPTQRLLDIWRGKLFSALRRDLILNQLKGWPACQDCGIWMAHVTSSSVQDGIRTTTNMITEIVQREER